jgi:putative FmdB family regulatory protein
MIISHHYPAPPRLTVPTYEYACKSCKKRYELRESFSAATEHPCEKCKTGVAKRVLHAPRVMFKGSGWYITDSKSTSTTTVDSESKEGKESKKDSDSPAETKAEKKPSTKAKKAADSGSSPEPAAT